MQAEVEVVIRETIGLRLPDGTEIFPPETWHGRGFETAEDRKVVLGALVESAGNLGIDSAELLSQYVWIDRKQDVLTIIFPGLDQPRPLDDPALTTVEDPNPVDAEEVPLPPEGVYDPESD